MGVADVYSFNYSVVTLRACVAGNHPYCRVLFERLVKSRAFARCSIRAYFQYASNCRTGAFIAQPTARAVADADTLDHILPAQFSRCGRFVAIAAVTPDFTLPLRWAAKPLMPFPGMPPPARRPKSDPLRQYRQQLMARCSGQS